MEEKKSIKEKLLIAKENTDVWADNHPVIGFPVRHPVITNILTLVLAFFIAGCVKGCSSPLPEVPESSILVSEVIL